MEKRFNDKVAVVTGAGDGMGRQFALDLAREGADVVVTDIDHDAMDRVVAEIEYAGGRALGIACDVSSRAQIDAVIDQTVAEFGTVNILINNAGLLVSGTIEETSDELIDKTLDINVKGILYAIRRVTPIMKAKGYGRIVNVASITGKRGDNSTIFVYG
ncbi:MAG: SDR family NAD(P)-dependent oxidoreductase, partial [Spirochaetia bacterium]